MNKKEAILAMLEGKFVRRGGWLKECYLYCDEEGDFRNEGGSHANPSHWGSENWELALVPPKKRTITFYRRKWVANEHVLNTPNLWAISVEKFDEIYCDYIYKSDEIEEREVEL